MAKRRNLKKDIDYLCDELRIDSFGCLIQTEYDDDYCTSLVERIDQFNKEFRNRTQGASVKADSRLTKHYYKQLREDFNAEIEKFYEELKSLTVENSEN